MPATLPIELYQQITDKHGQEIAVSIANIYAGTVAAIEARGDELAQKKKLELREDLLKELASKAELMQVKTELQGAVTATREELRGEIKALREEMRGEFKAVRTEIDLKIERLDRKFSILLTMILFAIIITNQNSLTFILKVFGILK
ncbi:MAG: hypothetical protein MUF71_20745 [Candidatus Kapabacteria bacterium]|jgi:hypothetical protein|nr:hypothetical protein [Candidatus Kapabacteria bacterium]